MRIKDDLKMYFSLLFSDFSFNFCKAARVKFGDTESLREGLSAENQLNSALKNYLKPNYNFIKQYFIVMFWILRSNYHL